ncbi:DUF4157 domain-containing protein [Mucilaginibacter angelicae]|uniref:DUF4157 domain-containing protein n=1 Tax=Mucilaginibacter angelicae TaxID=869718 RepID=A0ABV6LF26_9SPHI
MDKAKVTRNQQQTSSQASAVNGDKAARGYPAVTRFAQAPAPSADSGNGLPHQLRQGVETLSGMSMADTTVHYNSTAPAQIGALAYAAGNQIHLGPGQEQHLPHEAWHIVQQKQGRVKPTLQAKGLAVNDDSALETEADVMGRRAVQLKTINGSPLTPPASPLSPPTEVVQRKIGFEFQAVKSIVLKNVPIHEKQKLGVSVSKGRFDVYSDVTSRGAELELVTKAVDETTKGRGELVDIMDAITTFLLSVEDGGLIGHVKNIDWKQYIAEKTKEYDDLLAQRTKLVVDERIKGETKEKDADEKSEKKEDFEEKTPKFFIHKTGKHFHPQATVGVKFENVFNLIEHLTNAPVKKHRINKRKKDRAVTKPPTTEIKVLPKETEGEAISTAPGEAKTDRIQKVVPDIIRKPQDAAAIFGWGAKTYQTPYKETWTTAVTKVNNFSKLTPKVKGLVTIFFGLAESLTGKYAAATQEVRILKNMMPFMLRTGFMPFFNNLDAKEKEELKLIDTNDLNKKFPHLEITIKEVFEDMMKIDESDEKGDCGNDSDDDDCARFQEDNRDYDDDEKKVDLLQKEEGYYGHGGVTEGNRHDDYGMETINDIGISDSEKTRRRGALIELRKLGSEVPPEKLTEFALAVFDLIVLINALESSSSSSSTSSSSPLSTPPPSLSSSS